MLGTSAAMAMLVTHIAASTCSFTWMLIEYAHKREVSLVGIVSGAVTGLVVITPAAGFVDQTGAFVMGLFGALSCYPAVLVKNHFGLDQKPQKDGYPDAFGVHAIGGIVGVFWTGLFANPDINVIGKGAFYFNAKLLGWQIVGIIFVVLWTAVWSAIIMFGLKFTVGIDVPGASEPSPEVADVANPKKTPSPLPTLAQSLPAPTPLPISPSYPDSANYGTA
jgi:Amt family ammonium transporter